MTGEEGKCGGGTGTGGDAGVGNTNTNLTDNVNNVNANVHANVNANINASQQNGGPEKAPVVGGTNVETLPRAGKQNWPVTRLNNTVILILFHPDSALFSLKG
ncbi:hypothetical protein WN48_02173 [Eufriesea mexicana]|uniref:Uncharacterized protein n=1 Tax=Eufriesea mexicana TaxID=516756 RepID=A0A310SPJ5_9HYME|nr:hypothetical protein WN48_02173 [Eufriesea mexicana]